MSQQTEELTLEELYEMYRSIKKDEREDGCHHHPEFCDCAVLELLHEIFRLRGVKAPDVSPGMKAGE